MQITYATEAAPGHVNEDRAVCGPGWAVVLDGATAPEGIDSGCIHDVSWLVSHLADAIWELRKAHGVTCDLENPDSPSSTVSIVLVSGGALDYLTLGDSPIVVRAPGEGLTVISDDRLSTLPC